MIRKRVRYESLGSGLQIRPEAMGWVDLYWHTADALAVHLRFPDGIHWAIGRNLFLQGLQYPVGLGDVRIDPYATRIAVTFSVNCERSLVLLNRPPVDEFAQQLQDVDDTPDIDGLIEQIQRWGSR